MQIGNFTLHNQTILAPMAGVTDLPFRQLCKKLGAGMAVSEMIGSTSLIRGSKKTQRRAMHLGESIPRVVQIVGTDPDTMAAAAKLNADQGAQIIDINLGCPAKKVCNMLAGSALLKHEALVAKIFTAVVHAVDLPITVKIRTGWDQRSKNGVQIAKIAESCGIKAIAVHGRTRCCFFRGEAEYTTIAAIKQSVKIPVIANGDITSAEKAKAVLNCTQADAVMIGRAAQGAPWIFQQINHYLQYGQPLPEPDPTQTWQILTEHLQSLYDFYTPQLGLHIARKHVGWYIKNQPWAAKFRHEFNQIQSAPAQLLAINRFFENLLC